MDNTINIKLITILAQIDSKQFTYLFIDIIFFFMAIYFSNI